MEILSDATFRGATTFKKDVTISGGDFFITRDDNTSLFYVVRDKDKSDNTEIVHIDGGAHITGNTIVNGHTSILGGANIRGGANINGGTTIYNSLNLSGFNKINTNGKSITFPSQAGTLALTSQIPTVPSDVARVKSLPIDFDVAADCTRFCVPGANGANVYSLQMFKWNDSDGVCGYYLKNVDLAVVSDSNTPGSFVVVEKSSSFAISASDNYSIKIVY